MSVTKHNLQSELKMVNTEKGLKYKIFIFNNAKGRFLVMNDKNRKREK